VLPIGKENPLPTAISHLFYGSKSTEECPVCTPFGPFGMVPEAIAIEAVLMAEVSPFEKEMRAKTARRQATLDWLLGDKPAGCPACGWSGKWQNPYKKKDSRKCFSCDGKGTFV